MLRRILAELRAHAPFTIAGSIIGIAVTVLFVYAAVPASVSERLFEAFHPLHVMFSALVTTAMYRLHSRRGIVATFLVGYVGAVGIGTVSDCIIPYLGELLMGVHDEHVHAGAHIGFIELWWLVNPLAVLGIVIACVRPATRLPHAAHVLLSTSASLFHMLMAIQTGRGASALTFVAIPLFLFLAVWVPCCTSDIVFPMLLCRDARDGQRCTHRHDHSS